MSPGFYVGAALLVAFAGLCVAIYIGGRKAGKAASLVTTQKETLDAGIRITESESAAPSNVADLTARLRRGGKL